MELTASIGQIDGLFKMMDTKLNIETFEEEREQIDERNKHTRTLLTKQAESLNKFVKHV